jgi:hypothetical protein
VVATEDAIDASPEETGVATTAAPARALPDRVLDWVGIAIVAACCIYILVQLQPRLLFLNTTPTGGDTGAHVWFPAYLRDHLLPWRLAGWSPDYYAGFPAGQFYFPTPALLIVLLDVVIPYNVAFKLVTALGPLLLPVSAYVFGRGLRAPRPAPALFAVGVTAFLFFKDGGDSIMRFDHHIMGGTLTSTLAGEFSFTIALACALFFLGTLARALDRGRALWIPALFLAATLTSHLVVGVFAFYAALVIWLFRRPIKNATRALAIGAVGVALTAVWLLPLAASLSYTTDMRYEPVGSTSTQPWLLGRLFGLSLPATFDWLFLSEMWYLHLLALVALGAGIAYRRRATFQLAAIAFAAALVFCGWEVLRDIFGKAPAWNLRLLPFWYLMWYLIAALGAAEIARWAGQFCAWVAYGSPHDPEGTAARASDQPTRSANARVTARAVTIAILVVAFTGVALARVNATRGYIPYWAKYNYAGYEGGSTSDFTKKGFNEYRAFMDVAGELSPGRMLWEPNQVIGQYGTPLALTLLPYWTDGRIPSMEAVYYEAAGTTGYHFLTAATLSPQPSNAVRGLPYRTSADFDLGVRYMQLLGVRYYAAMPDMQANADRNPALREVASVPDLAVGAPNGWKIYEVADSAVVEPLRYEPVVARNVHGDLNWKCEGKPRPAPGATGVTELSAWECLSVPWFDDPAALDRPLTTDGPAEWKRAEMKAARGVPKTGLPSVKVSNVRQTDDTIEFDVSRTGVPVMVKVSYFPNWEAHGADGPWRATPNFMVVVPTSRHVRLSFGTSPAEWAGRFVSVLGLAGLGGLVWWSARARATSSPAPVPPAPVAPADDRSPPSGPGPNGAVPEGGGGSAGEGAEDNSGRKRRRWRIPFPSRFAR